MGTIKALGVNNITSPKSPKIAKINALGISKNIYVDVAEENTYFHEFLPYADINKLVDEYNNPLILKKHNSADLLIFYLLGSKNELYIAITGKSRYYIDTLTSQNVYEFVEYKGKKITFKEYLITSIINDKKEAFVFTYDEISNAINDAIANYKFTVSENNTEQETKFTAPSQLLKYKVNLKEKGIIKLLQEVNRTISKMRAEERHSYNEWIISKADPYNYFGIHISNKSLFK